ncbi:MAG: thiamine phosphate synthase, partial [Thermoleophilia bacterium]|nr:thiamine phosphate synthase [Thermoleophilia bacterium]
MDHASRDPRLAGARLYFVCDAGLEPVELDGLLGQALAGGAEIIQLRDKHAPAGALRAAAALFAAAAAEHGALFIVNDDPELAAASDADGVHVGQEDAAVEAAREIVGEAAIVGLSTHRPEQLDAALAAGG